MKLDEMLFGTNKIQTGGYTSNPTSLISSILPTVYIVAGLILFIYLVVGGFMLIASAGNEKQAEGGKQAVTNAIIGFVIIFASYWIIQIIQIITGLKIL